MPSTVLTPASVLRTARVGDQLPRTVLDRARARRLDATAMLVPGRSPLDEYRAALEAHADEFGMWDGRVVVTEADGDEAHRLLMVDRYGQVYAVHEATTGDGLPGPDALTEWFRFLATACPECGVLDDPVYSGPTP